MPIPLRWVLLAILALVLFALAMSGDVYNATSPVWLSWHVLVRKTYSIGAFALVGTLYSYARRGVALTDAALAVALYSGTIEVGQFFVSDEALAWNLIDVTCGGIGGALGAAVLTRFGGALVR